MTTDSLIRLDTRVGCPYRYSTGNHAQWGPCADCHDAQYDAAAAPILEIIDQLDREIKAIRYQDTPLAGIYGPSPLPFGAVGKYSEIRYRMMQIRGRVEQLSRIADPEGWPRDGDDRRHYDAAAARLYATHEEHCARPIGHDINDCLSSPNPPDRRNRIQPPHHNHPSRGQ